MKHTRLLVIHCSATTCASAPGKFCDYVEVARYGTEWRCGLYKVFLKENADGWLARTETCMKDFFR